MNSHDLHVNTPLVALEEHWVIAAASHELTVQPMARELLGHVIVLFRDQHGVAQALEDRCLHRQVSLSLGAVRDGALSCPYHGFRFAGDGRCVHVPSGLREHKLPAKTLRSYPVCEQDGSVWVYIGKTPPIVSAPHWPAWELRGYATEEVITTIEAPLLPILDNFVDTAHTGFVHAGLFRGDPSREVTAQIERRDGSVRIETLGESDVQSLAGRLLVPAGETIRHTDEVILPFTVRVDYWLGPTRHLLTTSICIPETQTRTRVYTRVSARFSPVSRPLARALVPLTRKILAQDKVVLENQALQVRRHGAHWEVSVAADAPTLAVARAFADYCSKRDDRAQKPDQHVSYRL